MKNDLAGEQWPIGESDGDNKRKKWKQGTQARAHVLTGRRRVILVGGGGGHGGRV
jgi:hypothetical protein